MANKPSGPLRRAQLIAPFGVGAMVTVPGGTSLIIAGLDYWYKRQGGNGNSIEPDEFAFDEWRLKELLSVNEFRLPPDFRNPAPYSKDTPNLKITIPALRFPAWHSCPDCMLLTKRTMYEKGSRGRIKCEECQKKKKTRYLFQVSFVAMCDRGHLQDFPWMEWVHHSHRPECEGPLRLRASSRVTLAGQTILCDKCGAWRTLAGITTASPENKSTILSSTLAEDGDFLCQGFMPWLGPEIKTECNAQLRGTLRSASNVYYAHVRSSIYLPCLTDSALQELELLLQTPPLSTLARTLVELHASDDKIVETLLNSHRRLIQNYSPDQIVRTVKALCVPISGPTPRSTQEMQAKIIEKGHTAFRYVEFTALRIERNDALLKIRMGDLKSFDQDIARYFSRIMLVDKLQETRALAGFTRVFPDNDQNLETRKTMLWKNPPEDPTQSWLPAYKVYGEGIYFEFQEAFLHQWERSACDRIRPLANRYDVVQKTRQLRPRAITPRFVLIHTFAHLIMNRLTFECGYSTAALRERLYVSSDIHFSMAGVLIYTADGDSEGTMGGLVRMGKPGQLEKVIRRALEGARWCSADPVCMEMGKHYGQGPDSCNLAACHNCALVPETACEEFNRFLDRGVVVGDPGDPDLGFFKQE